MVATKNIYMKMIGVKMKLACKRMPALIIVEGPDLAGKSTFITHFDDNKYIKYHYGAGPVIKTAAEYFEMMTLSLSDLWKKAILAKKDLIIDRSWISDAAYEHVRKDGGRVDESHKLQYNGLFLSMFRKIATVLLIPPFNVIEERYKNRGDDFVTIEQLEQAYKYYNDLSLAIDSSPYDCIKYGIPTNNLAATVLTYTDASINMNAKRFIDEIEIFTN